MSNRTAIDIGSTIVKVAKIGDDGCLLDQKFLDRDYERGITVQVGALIDEMEKAGNVIVCSSANGGLSVGLVCLTKHFSGSILQTQVLLSGANPMYLVDFDEREGDLRRVDILLLGGGVDCEDVEPIAERLGRFNETRFRYSTLVYAGNRFVAPQVLERFPDAVIVANPLSDDLRGRSSSVWQRLREVYLQDLIHKDGVSDIQKRVGCSIRPTPEVVNRGFHRLVSNHTSLEIVGPCLLIDVGGATTDIHYSIEIVSDDSEQQPNAGSSVARYVFTDLGVFASRESTALQLRTHPRLYEFLSQVCGDDVSETYRQVREGDYTPSPTLLCYACIFFALDRFVSGSEIGLPKAELGRVSEVLLTGGAPSGADEAVVGRLVGLFLANKNNSPKVIIDRDYRIWVEGITWSANLPWSE